MNVGSSSVVTTESRSPNHSVESRNMRDTDTIFVRNCKTSGLGIKIVGGKSTVGGGDYGIFVKKILAGGRAEAEGHLKEGDQLLEVNGESMLGISNDKAISLLRNAAETNNVKLLVSRDSEAREEFASLMEALNGNGFGMLSGPGAFDLIKSGSRGSSRASTPSPTMGKRSWVMSAGRMSPLALGRHGSPNWSPSNSLDRPPPSLQRMQAVDLSSTGDFRNSGPVDPPPYQKSNGMFQLNLGAVPSTSSMNGASNNPYSTQMNGESPHANRISPKHAGAELQSDSEVTIDSGLPTDRHSSTPSPNFDSPGELQVVRIPITTGLGLCIVGGTNRSEGPHIFVDNLIDGGDAQRDNRLLQGDQLVTVNGETLVGVTHEQAKSLLTRLKLRKDITEVEIAFIRGGHSTLGQYSPPNHLVNGNSPGPSHYAEDDNQLESPPLSSRSSLDNGADLGNTDTELNEMLQTSGSSGEMHASAVARSSPFVGTAMPVYSSNPTPLTTQMSMPPQSLGHVQSGHPHHFAQSLPPHSNNGFYPTMSSTPTSHINGLPNGHPLSMAYTNQGQINGFGTGMDPASSHHQHQFTNGSIHVSPIAPTLQPSSVPFYLQQDLEALRRVSEQYPSQAVSQQASLSPRSGAQPTSPESATQSLSQRQRRNRFERSTRKLSLDPYTKLKVEKLEVALRYLGFEPTEDQQRVLRARLPIDHNGCTTYGDFVNAARQVFSVKLNDPHLNTSAFQFAIQDINTMERKMQLDSQQAAAEVEAVAKKASEDVERFRRERDEALREVQHLRKALKRKDQECQECKEEVMKTRREAKALLEESHSLHNRIHLASQAQEASKSAEEDYEEVIKLLENEVAELKLKNSQKTPDPKELEELQKRLVVLGCQLRKAEVSKRTYEVSTEKLIRFAELVHDVLSQNSPGMHQQRGRGEPARKSPSGGAQPPSYLARHAKHNPTTLAKEAREVVKSVKALIEEEPLPFGWEEAYTPDGVRYYINHVTQQTSWLHPVTHVQHLPPIMENKEEGVKETKT